MNNNQFLNLMKKMAIPFVFLGVIFIAGLCLYFCGMRYKTSINAIVEGGHPISIASRVDGQVKEVFVVNNSSIKANSVILELNSQNYERYLSQLISKQDDLKSKIDDAKKIVADLKPQFDDVSKTYSSNSAKLELAKEEYTKSVEMYKEGILSKEEYDKDLADLTDVQDSFKTTQEAFNALNEKLSDAESDVKSLEAEVKSVELELVQAKYNLSNAKIYAPEDGQIVDLRVKKGDVLRASQVFATLKPKKVWVVASYKANQFENVENGQLVWIKLDSVQNKKFKGHIDSIVPLDAEDGKLVSIKVLFDESLDDFSIVPGTSMVLKLRERR